MMTAHDTARWFSLHQSSKAAQVECLLEVGTSFKRSHMEKELPRLTGALREYGGVSSRLSREVVKLDEAVLFQKREKKKRREGEGGGSSWGTIAEEVAAQCGKQHSVKVWSAMSYMHAIMLTVWYA